MRLDPRKYLWDAARAAEQARTFAEGYSLDGYLANAMLRAAVERQFEIIGEALNQCPRLKLRTLIADRVMVNRVDVVTVYASDPARRGGGAARTPLQQLLRGTGAPAAAEDEVDRGSWSSGRGSVDL